jgi:IS5 family transposase
MAEESLYDSDAMRRFAGLELGDDPIPDETTILNFRYLLERHALPEAIFAEVNSHPAENGVTLRSGTLVDATIIDAPPSTKKTGKRDPEMTSTKKGNDWYFGMKAHVDANSGVVHSLETSTAKLHDSRVWDDLLHDGETSVWADKTYVSAEREAVFDGPGKFWGVMRKAPKGGELHPTDEHINRLIAKVRSKVGHPFRILKRQFGYIKTRYRGLAKNRAQLFSLFALGNLYLVRRQLMA